MSKTIERAIEVDAPVRVVYDQWTQFEDFPKFMEGVREVRQIDEKRLQWCVEIEGQEKQWCAAIVEQTPDTRIAWRSADHLFGSGAVNFDPIDGRTRVTLQMTLDTAEAPPEIGDAEGALASHLERNLQQFKTFIEARGAATGAWRGEIHGGLVVHETRAHAGDAIRAGQDPL